MKKTDTIMGYIRNIIFGGQLLDRSRLNKKDFTRNRKVGFVTLVCMILNMIRKSAQLEVDGFLKKFGTDELINFIYTKQSFSEARQKLSPEAFVMLNDEFVHQSLSKKQKMNLRKRIRKRI